MLEVLANLRARYKSLTNLSFGGRIPSEHYVREHHNNAQ